MFYETWRIRTEAGQSQSSSGGTTLELGGGGGTMQAAGPGGGQIVETLLSTTYYYYNDQGNVTRVVTEKENVLPWESRFEATQMVYARNGRAMTYGLAETWDDYSGGQFINHVVSSIHEYRYDGARQRYLKRELNPENPLGELSSLWTDYDGDRPYGDFTVSGGVATEVRSFQPGFAKVEPWTGAGGAYTQYYHTDMIGTTRHMTNASGNETGAAVYTAFGERMSGSMGGPGDRYGYAGSSGYQADENFPFLHVGHRYYDPAIGRFLQRDPIGISGGANVYEYVWNNPVLRVDPSGLRPHDGLTGEIINGDKPNPLPVLRPQPETPTTEEELESIRRNKRAWDLVFAALCIAASATPGAQPIAVGIGLGLLGREGVELLECGRRGNRW